MSSFFTVPASEKKRKRDEAKSAASSKRRNIDKPTQAKSAKSNPGRDESISSGASDEEPGQDDGEDAGPYSSSDSEGEDETAAERRLRLAEQYLHNIREEVDEIGYDAEDIDRDLIAERIQEDVAETKGKLFKYIASSLDFSSTSATQFRSETRTTTSIATNAPYAYTVTKDLCLTKWELPDPPRPTKVSKQKTSSSRTQKPVRRRPKKLLSTRGNSKKANDLKYMHHTGAILCVAASDTGKFVATGGADKRLIVWSAADLKPLRVFTQHRDSVISLAFRKGTNQLYSCSKDRTIKTWSLNELAYVETLFGHQDEVVDIAAGQAERCISVGARDRTARLWKVVEETQLVFRSGSTRTEYTEGSLDRVALVDEETFVTGSDNGTLALWSLQKKKPIATVPLAHGLEHALTPAEASAEQDPDPRKVVPKRQPRWITALATIPYSDIVVSGSWDGVVRVWRVATATSGDGSGAGGGFKGGRKVLEAVGVIGGSGDDPIPTGDEGAEADTSGAQHEEGIRGIVNDLSCFERGERGQESLCVVAAVGTEQRLGRWKKIKGGKSGAIVFEIPSKGAAARKPKRQNRKAKKKEKQGDEVNDTDTDIEQRN